MSALIWEEPPRTAKSGRKDWAAVARELRERPGVWAIIDQDCPSTSASKYGRGINKAFPRGEFEFTVSGVKNSRAEKLYARYVGGEA